MKAYLELLKPRVMGLAILSAAVGMAVAPSNQLSLAMHILALFFIALGAGASGCFNMWWEHPRDALMERTKSRPIPAAYVTPNQAFWWATFLAILSLTGLGALFNAQAALWMAVTIAYYVIVYTIFLKPRTDQSIVIGGLAGALPPLIGEAVVTGTTSPESWLLCALIFFWTPPHFWSLALMYWRDYVSAGFPIRPHTRGDQHTRRDILYYAIVTNFVSLAPWIMGQCRFIYGYGALWLGLVWVIRAWQLYLHKRSARSFFGFSIIYLFSLLLLRLMDVFVMGYKW